MHPIFFGMRSHTIEGVILSSTATPTPGVTEPPTKPPSESVLDQCKQIEEGHACDYLYFTATNDWRKLNILPAQMLTAEDCPIALVVRLTSTKGITIDLGHGTYMQKAMRALAKLGIDKTLDVDLVEEEGRTRRMGVKETIEMMFIDKTNLLADELQRPDKLFDNRHDYVFSGIMEKCNYLGYRKRGDPLYSNFSRE
ncbi:hypothetical protein K491DRAFT_782927 [Lophiostoma macrostomum CBS 122681]|uniref:Uncharacterized protein n=1 Tax=Lophiostoma macrostomum CBS 122681 TaxID=1314788 RepID=A0A6A6SSK4_9PLEO|nr:hypothetical protein K491DRAFT_782927 [Lophiostoma macrostomum CBS 122681]